MPETWQIGGFGLYIHWPFCAAKCPYCDFNSHVAQSIDHSAWCNAYLEEIRKASEETDGRVLQSVFFGGGTPSLMRPETVGAVMDCISDNWTLANDFEVTLEANPTSVEADKFAAFRDAGVNRISLGIQSLDDPSLRRLGRMHSAAEGRVAIDIAQKHFDRVSIDLMYGLQGQSLDAWVSELSEALAWGLSHMSLYHLTIEDGTVFGARHRAGQLAGLPDEDLSADLFEHTQAICSDAGLRPYEVSNFARPGEEARHNLIYWRSGDYVGVGPGAHGRVSLGNNRFATEQTTSPYNWLKGERLAVKRSLLPEEQADELLMMGLRTIDGVDLSRWSKHAGSELPIGVIEDLSEQGWISLSKQTLLVTPKGRPLLNVIIEKLALG